VEATKKYNEHCPRYGSEEAGGEETVYEKAKPDIRVSNIDDDERRSTLAICVSART
jgi:hypothetical protein